MPDNGQSCWTNFREKIAEEPLTIIVCASYDHNRNLTTEDNDQSGLERAEDSREPN